MEQIFNESKSHESREISEETPDEKTKREKMDCSHRVIEKRRRDRINHSLLQLSKLVPIEKFNKKNSGKLEKAEILEVTVHYLSQQKSEREQSESSVQTSDDSDKEYRSKENSQGSDLNELSVFLRGFKQCMADATNFFQDIEELDVSEGRCHRLIQHLKKQIIKYERKERDFGKVTIEERLIWDGDDSSKPRNRRSSLLDSSSAKQDVYKRKSGDLEETSSISKKARASPELPMSEPVSSEPDRSCVAASPSNSNSEVSSNIDPTSMRNFMPFVFPNVPVFTTFPMAAGANNVSRYQSPQAQFPTYPFQQSTPQYIPVALPQFPVMGMNFVPGFGMVNGEQAQNGSLTSPMPTSVANGMPMQNTLQNSGIPGMPSMMTGGMPNGFFPSMYTNGLHANIMAMRPRDSGYESSEKSSSSKASRSETSPQSFSDDSCQSYVP